jgi:hypothetical protein
MNLLKEDSNMLQQQDFPSVQLCKQSQRVSHNNGFHIVVTFLRGKVFTGRRIETAILLLLPIFGAVRMFTDIPLLL